ncbi:metallophosphoesterase [Periweissella cryptocerci]|uniref:Phosphoesterase n=1 Tax=Periweissella cryptocerci TaxID=2506420 RepID=A0A4P6YWK5_9LACO|nr:metallophosphoesterase [Periweissella cryptocerci]QBO37220.1 metallophosphoesterase [Periweissella cryptocerci]
MQYVIVSDTHGDRGILVDIFKKYADTATQIFYNGDSELAANDSVFTDVSTVKGNMDFDFDFANEQTYQDDNVTVFQAHGHLLGVNTSLTSLLLRAEEVGANIATFGHTHQLGVEMINGILAINPGSISQPRGQYSRLGGTYVVVTVENDKYKVQYCNRELAPIANLHFSFNR